MLPGVRDDDGDFRGARVVRSDGVTCDADDFALLPRAQGFPPVMIDVEKMVEEAFAEAVQCPLETQVPGLRGEPGAEVPQSPPVSRLPQGPDNRREVCAARTADVPDGSWTVTGD
ncbi:hypothetical protein [Streptomyces pseudovenezuelae]|uniref:hypothetical protein n=1 Tax=Streptomyces pseudovenezuelae TaxID=67350 RepID=UPI0024734F55|nr:hypothetical protein [Streptomyces pseudovenezuelae]